MGSDAGVNTTIGNTGGLATVSNLTSVKMDSTDATTSQTIGNNLTTGSLSLARGNLTTGNINIGRLANTFANNSRVIIGTFKSIEQSIACEFDSRIYKRVFGVHSANTPYTEQTCYAAIINSPYNVAIPVFKLDIPAGTNYITQLFDITAVGSVDNSNTTYVFKGSFLGGINEPNSACFTGTNPAAFGYQTNSAVTNWTFTREVNKITLNYTQSQATGESNITVKIVSNIGRPGQNQFLITPLC